MIQLNQALQNSSLGIASVTNERKTSFEKQNYDDRHFHNRYINAIQRMANGLSKTTIADGKYFKFELLEPRFPLKPMSALYSNESVIYFTEEGLENIQVYIVNGLIYNNDLSLYESSKELDEEYGDGEMIVMDKLGNTFIAPKERGVFHHSSFFSGGPVAFAALCYVKEGKIQTLVRYSGHYSPTETEETSFLQQLNITHLVEEQFHRTIKIRENGSLVQVLSMSSKQKVSELFDFISDIGGYNRIHLRLICGGKAICDVEKPIAASPILGNGNIIHAMELRITPNQSILPVSQFELKMED